MAIQENPYLPPAARVADAQVARGGYIEGGRAVAPGQGWEWIASGWRTFKAQPGTWILLVLALGFMVIAVSLIPFLGSLALPLLMPVFVAGLMLACDKLERDESIAFADLFAGFQRGTGPLVLLGLIGLGLTFAVAIPAMVILFVVGFSGGFANITAGGVAVIVLVYIGLLLPVYMALWFGPPLVALQELPPTRAIAESFRGCLKNIVPFLVYSAVLFLLAILATLPLLLGWFVLGPVMIASIYAAFRDIYFER